MYFTFSSQMIHDNFSSLITYINIFYDIITIGFKNVSCIYRDSYYYIRSLYLIRLIFRPRIKLRKLK
ncbi:MAG TPA: hypothetical protein DEU03_24580 [Bacillus sp. (in: Bacteria)]|uniref:Uncharacterized protein n=1 Tax=Bacillus cereus TaxID=1396 RepID=A0A9X8ZWR1_BACCE|nr:hypothetical protein BUM91_18700 [Bacillus thuringiensis]OTX88948.1 hypothetical protein BK726_13470 [Bacillus thuringiensis serovar londrina]PED41350.1 hypothetical protein CON26_24855 [Bacillus cereus]PKS16412.1 hypothetical protein CX118_14190 [Bacillus sp. BI3]HCF56236.1 hypothetical protein [Bacillus sp. (in: firmicutes)]